MMADAASVETLIVETLIDVAYIAGADTDQNVATTDTQMNQDNAEAAGLHGCAPSH